VFGVKHQHTVWDAGGPGGWVRLISGAAGQDGHAQAEQQEAERGGRR
jgi:hypothetical protein